MVCMGFHVALPNDGSIEQLTELATAAENLGFDGVWLAEHVLPPIKHPDPAYAAEYDPLVLLGFIAAHTTTVRVGTSILVLPLRNPFVVAKQAATVDALSDGRLELGVGVGWDADEFTAVGAQFHDRGRRTDEAIGVLRHLWAGNTDGLLGEHYSFGGGYPTPVRPQGIPITIGGHSTAAVNRAARLGDRWQSIYFNNSGTDPATFRAIAADLKRRTEGRVTTAIKRFVRTADQVDALVDELDTWRRAGADDVVVWFGEPAVFGPLQERFARKAQVNT